MKKILLIATGGTIASRYTDQGLSPAIPAQEIIRYVPETSEFCTIDTCEPFSLDSANVGPKQWLTIARIIGEKYYQYDGFVICHGTDTLAYTAAALSYLIQNNKKPVVLTGSQKPIDLPVTDARTNLVDSCRFACDDRAWGVTVVFGGQAIAGTRAKKEYSKSYNAFSSINFPPIATLQDDRTAFYVDDKSRIPGDFRVYSELDTNVFLHKLIPGGDGTVLDRMRASTDALVIESFGVGGIPADSSYYDAIRCYIEEGRQVIMATQVVHEGSDMAVYEVGKVMKTDFDLMESYDMTLEACITKTMWALAETRDPAQFRRLFYTPVGHDILFGPL